MILLDNQSALDIVENPANHRKAKYIDIRYHAICCYLQNDLIIVDYSHYMPTNAQATDICIKVLGPLKYHQCKELLHDRGLERCSIVVD